MAARGPELFYTLFPRLAERRRQLAGTMSGGEQQMCAIGRALMSDPKLLLLDEPSAGLAPVIVEQVFDLMTRLRAGGLNVLIVEQNVQQVLRVVDRAYLLKAGSIRTAGEAAELLDSETIRNALQDIEAVIQTLRVDISPRAVFERTTLFSLSTRILVDAMKAAGLKRLIAVTGLGAGGSRGHGGLLYDVVVFPLLLKRVYDDKDVQEWIITSSGLDWTIVRPGLLTNRAPTGRYRVLTAPRDWRFGMISRADVADFLVRQVDDRSLIGTAPLLIM